MNERVFSRVMEAARRTRGYTQAELGKLCGVDQSTIVRRESGQHPVRETSLESTADALKLSVSEMLLEVLEPSAVRGREFDRTERNVLGRVVKNVRLSLGLTQAEFGLHVGVTQHQVSRRESGGAPLTEDVIDEMATRLGWSTSKFLVLGLTFKPKEPVLTDQTALRARLVTVQASGVSLIRIAGMIHRDRSRLTRFLDGASIAEDTAAALQRALDKIERESKSASA